MKSAEQILQSLRRDGYVVVPDLIPKGLLEPVKAAAARTTSKGRDESSGGWPHVRIVGKQFPPWPKGAREDIWGVQHIMHPDLEEPVFSQWYGSSALIDAVKTILGCTEDELQLELCGLLVNPAKTPFSLGWHRDTIPHGTPEDQEIKLLKAPRFGTQWNTALYDDECLLVVPKSHCRPGTEEERKVMLEDPKGHISGEVVVKLKAGETVFYDNNILHRAVYPTEPIRQTLHACMGTTRAGLERARNILQHDMEWVWDVKFEGHLEKMRENLIRMRGELGCKELGYSLQG